MRPLVIIAKMFTRRQYFVKKQNKH